MSGSRLGQGWVPGLGVLALCGGVLLAQVVRDEAEVRTAAPSGPTPVLVTGCYHLEPPSDGGPGGLGLVPETFELTVEYEPPVPLGWLPIRHSGRGLPVRYQTSQWRMLNDTLHLEFHDPYVHVQLRATEVERGWEGLFSFWDHSGGSAAGEVRIDAIDCGSA